jgi:hypothetical protein
MDMHPRLFAREEVEAKAVLPKYGGAQDRLHPAD